MSLGEAQELFAVLQEIEAALQRIDAQAKITERNVSSAVSVYQDLERLALRYLVLARRMGLPEDVERAITFINRLVVAVRMAMISINLMMASNPVTAAIGIAGLATSVLTMTDALAGYS